MTPQAQRILGRVDKSHDSLMPLIIRELLELVEKQREALKISRDANAVSVCFRGKHVKQLDGSVKYELSPTYHQTAKEKADEALGLTDETMERLGKE